MFYETLGFSFNIRGYRLHVGVTDSTRKSIYEYACDEYGINYPYETLQDVTVQLEQKITRKFRPYILSDLDDFFEKFPDFAKQFLYSYYLYLNSWIDEITFSDILFAGFNFLKQYLETYYLPNVKLKIRTNTRAKVKINEEDSLLLIQYAWMMKLYGLIFYTSKKFSPGLHTKITETLLEPLRKHGVFDKLFVIVKQRVYGSKKNRENIWKFLSEVMLKDEDYVVSEFFYNILFYILPIMHKSYNPIGFVIDFLSRQLYYLYTDVYQVSLTYLELDDFYKANIDYCLKVAFDKYLMYMMQYLEKTYGMKTSVFYEQYNFNKPFFDTFVAPLITYTVGETVSLPFTKKESAILVLYYSDFLKRFAKLQLIPRLLTSNVKQQLKNRVKLTGIKNVLDELYEHPNNLFKRYTKETQYWHKFITNVCRYTYLDLLNQKLITVRAEALAYELKIFYDFLPRAKHLLPQIRKQLFNMKQIQKHLV